MKNVYEEIKAALLKIEAQDASYAVSFDEEWAVGKTWEFDPMSDAIGTYEYKKTGKMRIRFDPEKDTMVFPEDANRQKEYIMDIESARILYVFIKNDQPHYWFALDMANQGKAYGLKDLTGFVDNVVGMATCVESV